MRAGGREEVRALRGPLLAAAAVVAAVGCTNNPEAQAYTPSLTWVGAERIGVQCVISSRIGGALDLRKAFCERVRTLAAEGAPIPVSVFEPGDPALLHSGTVALLVHASLTRADQTLPGMRGRLLVFGVRPFRTATENSVLFGAAPQVVSVAEGPLSGPAVDAAITAALAEVLPWRASPTDLAAFPIEN